MEDGMRAVASLAFLVLGALAGCRTAGSPSAADRATSPLIRVTSNLDAVRDAFNADAGRPRFVAILSPT
jgi:hypothetical protein